MADEIGDYDYLPFQLNYFPQQLLKWKQQDTAIGRARKENSLRQLKELLEGLVLSKDVSFEDDFLNAYLTHCQHDEGAAFTKLQNYLKFRKVHNYFYRNVNFDLGIHPSCRFVTFLPRRLSDGSVVVLLEPGYWDPEELPFENAKYILYMMFQQELRNPVTQASGFHVILEIANTGTQHYKYCTPSNGYLLNQAMFDVLPGNFHAGHIINSNFIVSTFLYLSKPWLPEFFKNNIYVHSSAEKLLEYFPKSVLPAKYGGSLKNYNSEMPDLMRKANEQHKDFPIGGQENTF